MSIDHVVIPEQQQIEVYTSDAGYIVIKKSAWPRWSEDDVPLCLRPEHVVPVCRAILKEVGIDLNLLLREVGTKDPTANERQRRHRGKLRDRHDQDSVTVRVEQDEGVEQGDQAKVAGNELREDHQGA
jgi:hypothetical protein